MIDRLVRTSVICSCILVLASLACPAWADIWYVGPGGTDDVGTGYGLAAETPFATLAYAIAQADAGDTVRVLDDLTGPGNTNVSLNKDSLVIEGWGEGVFAAAPDTWPTLTTADANPALSVSAAGPGCTVRYLTFYGGTNAAVILYPGAAGVLLDHCQFGLQGETTVTGLVLNDVSGCTVGDCQTARCTTGLSIGDGHDNAVINLTALVCTTNSLKAQTTENLTVSGGTFMMTSGQMEQCSILILSGTGVTVQGASILGGANGIALAGTPPTLPDCTQACVTGCDISDCGYCGLSLYNVARSTIAGNSIHENMVGMETTAVHDTLAFGNRFDDNTYNALHLMDTSGAATRFFVFLNAFSGNLYDLYGDEPGAVLTSPLKLQLDTGARTVKAKLGNHYHNWPATDAGGDGIADAPRTDQSGNAVDPAPLMKDFFDDPEAASLLWCGDWLGGVARLDLRNVPARASDHALADQASLVLAATAPASAVQVFRGGPDAVTNQNSFTGWLHLVAPLPLGQTLGLAMGHAADADGTDFVPAGPRATLTGDGSMTMLPFVMSGADLRVPAGRRLAVRLTNTSGQAVNLRLGGGWFALSAALPPLSLGQLWLNLM